VNFCPTDALVKRLTIISKSSHVGTIRSIPITVTCVFGNVVTIRAFPSFVTKANEPDSATAKLQPVIPISACKNFSRNFSRAKSVTEKPEELTLFAREKPEELTIFHVIFHEQKVLVLLVFLYVYSLIFL